MAEKKYSFEASDAKRESFILRAALCGPTGCGKTKTGLMLGTRMVERMGLGPLFVIDSENRSALRYAYSPRTRQGYRFKHVPMPTDDYSPQAYMAALDYCEEQGAGVVLIDSFSHAWNGINGVLEQVDQKTSASRTKNAFSEGWKEMTPLHNRLVQRLLENSSHLLFTLRAKMHYDIVENDRGRREPVKMGLAPVAREGIAYEPDLFFDMTVPDNSLIIGKSRCDTLIPGEVFRKPGPDFADIIINWIQDAEPSEGARSLGEAITIATAESMAAIAVKSSEEAIAARRKLTTWCKSNGVSPERHEAAQQAVRDRLTAAGLVASKAAAPPLAPAPEAAPVDVAPVEIPFRPASSPAEKTPSPGAGGDVAWEALAADLSVKASAAETWDEATEILVQAAVLPAALRENVHVAAILARVARETSVTEIAKLTGLVSQWIADGKITRARASAEIGPAQKARREALTAQEAAS